MNPLSARSKARLPFLHTSLEAHNNAYPKLIKMPPDELRQFNIVNFFGKPNELWGIPIEIDSQHHRRDDCGRWDGNASGGRLLRERAPWLTPPVLAEAHASNFTTRRAPGMIARGPAIEGIRCACRPPDQRSVEHSSATILGNWISEFGILKPAAGQLPVLLADDCAGTAKNPRCLP